MNGDLSYSIGRQSLRVGSLRHVLQFHITKRHDRADFPGDPALVTLGQFDSIGAFAFFDGDTRLKKADGSAWLGIEMIGFGQFFSETDDEFPARVVVRWRWD